MLNFKRKRGSNPNLVKRIVSSMLMFGILGTNTGQVNFASVSLSFEKAVIADIPPRRVVRFNPAEEHIEDSTAKKFRLNSAEEHNPLLRSDVGVNTEEPSDPAEAFLRYHNANDFAKLPLNAQKQLVWELDCTEIPLESEQSRQAYERVWNNIHRANRVYCDDGCDNELNWGNITVEY